MVERGPKSGEAGAAAAAWRIWVDTGGTFTDCVGVDPAGAVHRAKVLSSGALRGRIAEALEPGRWRVEQDWGAWAEALPGMTARVAGAAGIVRGFDPGKVVIEIDGPIRAEAGALIELWSGEEAPVLGARLMTGTPPGRSLPSIDMRLGTTRGTNALLERRGGRVALFVTKGFGDLLLIGTQQRPELFALNIVRPEPLFERVVEVAGRLASGAELEALDLASAQERAAALVGEGVRIAAVALMHSWTNPAHELALEVILREAGFEHVSLSSRLAPAIKYLPRAQTAVVNAYLAPVIEGYVKSVSAALADGTPAPHARHGSLRLMTSGGGLVSAREFAPKDSLLSGPAGGVVGAARAARAAGLERIIALDMGGTSTDVSRFDGQYDYVFEHEVGSAQILAPALAIESVAAGGGSVCWVDEDALRVGPRSAGNNPGPACYGAGGPLTITDCNLLLGRLDSAGFQIPVDPAPARVRLEELARELERRTGLAQDRDALLEGWVEIAVERMAEAIRSVSLRQGYDPAEYALAAFGGAGGQVACALAERLGMGRVIVPRDAGLLSALGLGFARIERFAQRQVLRPLSSLGWELEALLGELASEAMSALQREGIERGEVRRRILNVRLVGQETSLSVEHVLGASIGDAKELFKERYVAMYGHEPPDREVELESARVVVVGFDGADDSAVETGDTGRRAEPDVRTSAPRRARFGGAWIDAQSCRRTGLASGAEIAGPALVLEAHTTTVVDPGWLARLDASGALMLERRGEVVRVAASRPEAVRVELATGRLSAIARDMGETLRRTALSTNVKERLDFSCAILDAEAQLVVNAPHVPVHLGSLGVCVRAVREAVAMGPGDSVVTNHPGSGGSHLPDITVITPVFDGAGEGALIGYVASRAHHAEIGGTRPGSMPTDARTLDEEGVVIPPMHLVRAGVGQWAAIERVLRSGPFPSRVPADNLADLRAQLAANTQGAEALREFARRAGRDAIAGAMRSLAARAEAGVRRALVRLGVESARFGAEERLDDGSPIRVRIDIDGERAVIDFAGSAGVHPGNLNATPAIVRSAVIYVLRLLVDEALPLNEGLLRPVEIRIPDGMLSPPFPPDPGRCPAVAGGNVETSQRLVDALLKALRLCGCSQGTMNNIAFGNDGFGYYETVCGGAGAGPGFHGASGVHTHMTNTRITDPEILERRYPVRLDRFEIRRGSGGAGRWRGGDGVVREYTFLQSCSLSLITQHRNAGPYGMAGGLSGAPGVQRLIRANGDVVPLGAVAGIDAAPGDRLVLETPGGGGFGLAGDASPAAPPGR